MDLFDCFDYDARMTPAQCRAARALLDWSQQQLADAAGIGVVTLRQFETGGTLPRQATMEALMNCIETAGVELLCGNGGGMGVRMREESLSLEAFVGFVPLYVHRRLSALARQVGTMPRFGYRLTLDGRDSAILSYQGQRLGAVSWQDASVRFDPPVEIGELSPLSYEAFDKWVSRAEYRSATGL